MWQNLKNSPAEHTPIPLWILWCCCHGSQFLVLWRSCSLMQSLHVYDYFCYRKWNLEGNFGRDGHRDEGKGRRQRKSLLRWGELANCHSGLSKMSPKCETTKADVMRSIGYWLWSEVNAVSQYVSQISFSSDNVLRNAMSGNQIR